MPPKAGRRIKSSIRAGERSGERDDEEASVANAKRFAEIAKRAELDAQMGFPPFVAGGARMGWMLNMQPTYVVDSEWPSGRSAVDYYFMAEDGSCFKATMTCSPYFFLKCKVGKENEVEEYIRRRFENAVESMQRVLKEDLDLPNHLTGLQRPYLRLNFRNTSDLLAVRKILLPIANRNAENYKEGVMALAQDFATLETSERTFKRTEHGALAHIVGIREYDIPYHLRVAIDRDIRVGLWYTVVVQGPTTTITRLASKDVRPDPVILAFDIETSKMPLKFPDPNQDHIMMISYMVNGRGFLIVNRDIVSQDIEDFEYTPKADFPGAFSVCNVPNEEALLHRFFEHIQLLRPQIFVTYNGDFFDWPFIETRASAYGMSMESLIGIAKNSQGEFGGTYCVHMDCFCWVKRDSYLPAGSHGLKAVCSIKLGYDPLELDPELMTPLAAQDPHILANYSVSDAVATYYLYMKYVHPFIFSLCNIIPLMPDEVLRKGTGTLCETLLMAQAHKANVIMPNKYEESREKFYKGHMLDSETYIGGHVEALEAGVYRSDFQYKFKVDSETMHQLMADLDRALKFFLEHESHVPVEQVVNYQAVYGEIKGMLLALSQSPTTNDYPLIYHLDVGSMYPNIILTNRLQPSAMVDDSACAVCDFNLPGKQCQRQMSWSWRGEYFSATMGEYKMLKKQLESERFPSKHLPNATVAFHEISQAEQSALLKKRLSDYSQKVYRKTRKSEIVSKKSIVCQRENSFYIDTVRSFRDRRYDYKNLQKVWKRKLEEAASAKDPTKIEEASKLLVLYDSLQLAHKCILNSFYGYVMRKAARWYSMEMGGIVCETGAAIITLARQLIEKFGRPLELDTDGIWCMLPAGFPQNFSFDLINGKKVSFAYPCVMLNHLLFDRFTNHQYQTLVDTDKHEYKVSSENSIFFEIDGPYKAMVLPSSTEEGRQLKKRYAVFNEDGSLAELKGFEIKRRGELKLVKIFQSQIFQTFLGGKNLVECYQEVATVANYWLDILYTRGSNLEDSELMELICENRSMSKALEDYGEQKSTSISTAKRLSEFLGDQMVKDKGLACKFIISCKPAGQPVTNRAIPVAIFSASSEIRRHYLSKWLKDAYLSTADIREVIDWEYYIERLGSMIQKLIVIPAAMQLVPNPVPRVAPPDWLKKKTALTTGNGTTAQPRRLEQRKLTDMFANLAPDKIKPPASSSEVKIQDLEDFGSKRLTAASLVSAAGSEVGGKRPSVGLEAMVGRGGSLAKIDLNVDYAGWVASRKAYWRQLSLKLNTMPESQAGAKRNKTLGAYMDKDRTSITKTPWQIVSFEATAVPGEFKVWALIGSNTLRSVKLTCPRKIYFSTRQELPGQEKVHLRLPDGRSARFLYEISMSESVFKAEFMANAAVLLDPMLEGVWEASIPLEFHLLTDLGSTVSLDEKIVKSLAPDQVFQPAHFVKRSVTEVPYLTSPSLVYALYGCLQADSTGRAVLMMAMSNCTTVRILVVDEGMRRQLTAVRALWSQVLKQLHGFTTKPFAISEDEIQFEVDYFADLEAARRSLQRSFALYLDDRPSPTIVLNLSPHDPASSMPAFGRTPRVAAHSWLGPFVFPPLDWQRAATRRLLDNLSQINEWLGRRLEICRFGHVPLAHVQDEWLVSLSDIFLARMHRLQGYLLPWNDSNSATKDSAGGTDEFTLSRREAGCIDSPGLYQHVVVDFELSMVALNAILEFTHITFEGEEVPPVVGLLRSLTVNWINEYQTLKTPLASKLIDGLFRWIRSGTSQIVPPIVLRRVRITMDRAMEKLYAFLNHLGCTVVHGDHSRLLLATAKDHVDNAQAFVEYLKRQIPLTDGLAWLQLEPTRYWRALLWMNMANYCGFVSNPTDPAEPEGRRPTKESLMMRSDLSLYLPPALQKAFQVLMAEYVDQSRQFNGTTITQSQRNPKKKPPGSYLLQEEEDFSDEETGEESSSTPLLTDAYRRRFLTLVREAQKLMSGMPRSKEDAMSRIFPLRIGSHLAMKDGPLEMVKFLGATLSLDRRASQAIFKLVKQAYALLNIREFSDEAIFTDPCQSFTLPDVICAHCNFSRDMDFCRDEDILRVMESPGESVVRALCCPACSHPYPMSVLEGEIIEDLSGELLQYQRQDLICGKCRLSKADLMSPMCSCSGEYKLEVTAERLQVKIRVLSRISSALNLTALGLFIQCNF